MQKQKEITPLKDPAPQWGLRTKPQNNLVQDMYFSPVVARRSFDTCGIAIVEN